MNTDWQGVLVLGFVVVYIVVAPPLVARLPNRKWETFKRRYAADPQCGRPARTGVEREPSDVAALPRSPIAPVGVVDPRPTALAGPHTPVAAAAIHAAATGLQTPAGAGMRPTAPAGPRRRVVLDV